ncbi:zinc ribbon domain-containing protein [Leptolyngbya sp. FACHB-261]|uniref:zinc ribbon domain-containing protein n=1 Tax=Leptolyngbya sp. FACHB-261 TaxID=2692806 RepID=UPI001685D8FC|nr:zinc ribbon domain-containing protein [Leptolyngbya sp. FACHB-261]MBD2100899.1 zinc ribbon domain-containing protein [Leptolyngbya sp. FACHB-261]
MLECPRCHQPVSSTDVTCPVCSETLKAHGHPGMPLHRAERGAFLCDTCVYQADDSCTFPQRPQALSCTLYRSQQVVHLTAAEVKARYRAQLGMGERRYFWIGLGAVVVLAVAFTLLR